MFSLCPLPPEREKLIERHAGFTYPMVELCWESKSNKRLGLHIKAIANKVFYAKIYLKIFDSMILFHYTIHCAAGVGVSS